MKSGLCRVLGAFVTIILFTPLMLLAQVTAFTYQGRLDTNGQAANGSYDFQFRLYDAPTNGNQVPVIPVSPNVIVSNGLFTTAMDFGNNVFTGTVYWLEIAVQPHGGLSFSTLTARQQILPVPGAIFANSASNLLGNLPATQLSGTVAIGALPSSPNFSGTVTANSFSGNGGGLTNVNALLLSGLASSNLWQVGGNYTSNGILGILYNNVPLSLWAGNERLLKLESIPRSTGFASSTVAGNVTGGGDANLIWAGVLGGTIAGGGSSDFAFPFTVIPHPNVVSDDYGTVGGGLNNLAGNTNSDFTDAAYATVGGGYQNKASGPAATVAGGYFNSNSAAYSTIGGGYYNTNNGYGATMGGGLQNAASGELAVVAGGQFNIDSDDLTTIGGGENNSATTFGATIAGGMNNLAGGAYSAIGGGYQNTNTGFYTTVSGGGNNQASGNDSTVGGGVFNIASGPGSTVSGGGYDGVFSYGNIASGAAATVAGGISNLASGPYSFAAGTRAKALNQGTFVWADSQPGDFLSTSNNQFLIRALGGVGIGTPNPQGSLHVYSDNNPTVVRIQSSGQPGFGRIEFVSNPQSDPNQWRPGYIQSLDAGGFTGGLAFYLNGTGSGSKFGTNEVMRLVNGNVGIGTNSPQYKLHVVGGVQFTSGSLAANQSVSWIPGIGSWNFTSDRATKDRFAPVDTSAVLEKLARVPLSEWSYIGFDQRHIGPMAQDFHAQFPLNDDDKTLNDLDLHGVELAAIQGLNQKLEQKLEQKETEITDLKQRLEKLEQLVNEKSEVTR